MKRRNFFGMLGSVVLGCYLALDPKRILEDKIKEEVDIWQINPEWISAEYDIHFFGFDNSQEFCLKEITQLVNVYRDPVAIKESEKFLSQFEGKRLELDPINRRVLIFKREERGDL